MGEFHTPTGEEFEGLVAFATAHGREWKDALNLAWYNARVSEYGSAVHGLRNNPRFGPRGLGAFKFPTPIIVYEATDKPVPGHGGAFGYNAYREDNWQRVGRVIKPRLIFYDAKWIEIGVGKNKRTAGPFETVEEAKAALVAAVMGVAA